MRNFNPQHFRQQFPAITANDLYLDSAATALKPLPMIQATQRYYAENGATVHRSQHLAGQSATQQFEQARQRVANLLRAQSAESIIWTKGTTEAINLVAQSYGRPRLRIDDEIIVAESEHHSNLIPWLMLAQQTGAKIVKLPLTANYLPDLTKLPSLLSKKTRILAIGQMSNVTGGMPDLSLAIEFAHQVGAVVVVDGAQGIVHMPPDVQALDVDFYAFSAHKLYGPTGVGVLYANPKWLAELSAWQGGGKMVREVTFTDFIIQPNPIGLEAGTPNIAGVIGFNATLEWLTNIDQVTAEEYVCELAEHAYEKLSTLPGFICYRSHASSLLPFNFAGHHHHDIATLLAEQRISLRAGQHCAQPLLNVLGVSGTLRASFAPYNHPDEIDRLFEALQRSLTILSN